MMKAKSWKNIYGVVKNGVLKEFTVFRDKWARGNKDEESALMLKSGKSCCVGFMSMACGVPQEKLVGVGYVCELDKEYREMVLDPSDFTSISDTCVYWKRVTGDGLGHRDGMPDTDAYGINDAEDINDKVREKRLKQFFKEQYNVVVRFRNHAPVQKQQQKSEKALPASKG